MWGPRSESRSVGVHITPISRTGLWYANNELVPGANLNQRITGGNNMICWWTMSTLPQLVISPWASGRRPKAPRRQNCPDASASLTKKMPVKLMELHQTKGRNYDSKEWGKERLGAKIIISGKKLMVHSRIRSTLASQFSYPRHLARIVVVLRTWAILRSPTG